MLLCILEFGSIILLSSIQLYEYISVIITFLLMGIWIISILHYYDKAAVNILV